MISDAWLITRKDLWLLARDRRAVALLLILPMVFIAIVGMSTGQLFTQNDLGQQRKLVIADGCRSNYSDQLIEAFRKRDGLKVQLVDSASDAQQLVDLGRADAAVVIGPGFDERVDELRLSDVLDVKNGKLAQGLDAVDLTLETKLAIVDLELFRAGLFEAIFKMVGPIVGRKNALTRRYFTDEPDREADGGDVAEPAPARKRLEELEAALPKIPSPNAARKRGEGVYLILVPGFTVMFVFFLVNIMARSFISERELGTLRRLQMAPISPMSVLVGKTLPFYLISIAQCVVLFGCGKLLFGMSWGPHPFYLVPMILCTSLAATTLGLLLATLVKTDQQVSAYGTSMVIILAAISGCFMPRDWLPTIMQNISLFTPHAWALVGFDAVLARRSVDALVVARCSGMLLAFSTIFLMIGWWRFRSSAA
jgi:ABC-2 type transport system permease protein